MKKRRIEIISCLICMVLLLSGCVKDSKMPESSTLGQDVQDTLRWQEDVTEVFHIAQCVRAEGSSQNPDGVNIQLQNLSDKSMISFGVLLRFYDKDHTLYDEKVYYNSADDAVETAPGELTPLVGHPFGLGHRYVEAYISSIEYQDGTKWVNTSLNLMPKLQAKLHVQNMVSNVYQVKSSKMDAIKLELQLQNLSPNKTIETFIAVVYYVEANGTEHERSDLVRSYEGTPIAPNQNSDFSVWHVPGWEGKANVYITSITYTDGTKWENQDVPISSKTLI